MSVEDEIAMLIARRGAGELTLQDFNIGKAEILSGSTPLTAPESHAVSGYEESDQILPGNESDFDDGGATTPSPTED